MFESFKTNNIFYKENFSDNSLKNILILKLFQIIRYKKFDNILYFSEERKKSNLSEGEEPEVHYPFKISPFDKEALSWKSIKGSDVFLSNHLVDNNNSKQSIENEVVIESLHEFSDKFIESWSSRKPSLEMDKSEEEDPVFMNVDGKSYLPFYKYINI